MIIKTGVLKEFNGIKFYDGETIKEKTGIHIDEYSLEKLLEVYDITPKKQED